MNSLIEECFVYFHFSIETKWIVYIFAFQEKSFSFCSLFSLLISISWRNFKKNEKNEKGKNISNFLIQ